MSSGPTATGRRPWGLILRVVGIVLVIATVGVFGTMSYQDHAGVRDRTLRMLEASDTKHGARSTKGSGHSSPAGASVAPATTGAGVDSVSIPIGTVEASSPLLGSSVPVGSGAPDTSPAAPLPTTSTPATSQVNVAVLTPLLDTFQFGASVGFLLACNTAAGSISAAASQVPGLSEVITPVLAQISPECGKLSASAVSGLNTLNSELGALQALNAGSAPYFAELNKVFATLNMLAPQLQPLSGTITALGPLVAFFSGQPSGS